MGLDCCYEKKIGLCTKKGGPFFFFRLNFHRSILGYWVIITHIIEEGTRSIAGATAVTFFFFSVYFEIFVTDLVYPPNVTPYQTGL